MGSTGAEASYPGRLWQFIQHNFPHRKHVFINRGLGATGSSIFAACVHRMVDEVGLGGGASGWMLGTAAVADGSRQLALPAAGASADSCRLSRLLGLLLHPASPLRPLTSRRMPIL